MAYVRAEELDRLRKRVPCVGSPFMRLDAESVYLELLNDTYSTGRAG